jgi:hypothetical protein
MKNTVEFSVDVVGELTKNSYVGGFTAKTKLSVRETLRQDEIRRSILGADAQNASLEAQTVANAVAYLHTHITKAPDWWRELDGGLNVEDLNLLAAVNNSCHDAVDAEYKALEKEADESKTALKDLPE